MPENNPATPSSPPRKRRFFTLRNLGRALIGLAVFATLIALFIAEENWRGKRAWENYKREAEARGIILDWKKVIPPEVPDDQNFAMTPFLKPLTDFNPKPYKPGQSWIRDTNGYQRVSNFAKDFMIASGKRDLKEGMISFEAFMAYLRNPKLKKFDPNAQARIPRAEAAAQLLREMEPFDPVFDELEEASHRPYSRFNVNYHSDAAGVLLPHLGEVKKFVHLLSLKSGAELATGDTGKALIDMKLMLKFADSINDEPFLISGLVEIACYDILIRSTVWEGLASHAWNDAQLQEIQRTFSQVSFVTNGRNTMNGERVWVLHYYDYFRSHAKSSFTGLTPENDSMSSSLFEVAAKLYPNGWFYLEQLNNEKTLENLLMPTFSEDGQTISPKNVGLPSMNSGLFVSTFIKHNVFARSLLPALDKSIQKFAFMQAFKDEAMVACGLERNRLAGNPLPERLEELVPRFLEKVPVDVIGGAPLRYKKLDEKHFLLYSIGWNEKDDGGVTAYSKGSTPVQDKSRGDWVWPAYPEPAN